VTVLPIVVTVAVVIWAAGLMVTAVILAIRALRPRAAAEGSIPEGPQIAMILLVGIGGILVSAALVTAALVTERESHLARLHAANVTLEAQIRLYESHLTHLEQRLDSLRHSKKDSSLLAEELRGEISELRQRLASLR